MVFSQSYKALYSYDKNGNRITATIIWLNTGLKSDVVDSSNTPQITSSADSVSVPNNGYSAPIHDSFEGLKITVYPNPTHGILLVQLEGIENVSSTQTATNNINLFDIVGHKIMEISPLNTLNSINLLSQPTGTYIMTIQVGKNSKTYSIIKN
jgi:hypothetical protein